MNLLGRRRNDNPWNSVRDVINRRQFCTLTTSALLAQRPSTGLGAIIGLGDSPPLSATNSQFVLRAPLGKTPLLMAPHAARLSLGCWRANQHKHPSLALRGDE